MEGEDQIFRNRAVNSASNPESINRVAPIASPQLWLLIVGAAALVLVCVVWGVFGSIPISIRGTGLLIEGTQVVAADAPADGRILEVRAQVGDQVAEGDVIAILSNPGLELQLVDAEAAVVRLRAQDQEMGAAEQNSVSAALDAIEIHQRECEQRVSQATAAAADYSKAVETKRNLVRQGLLAEADLLGNIQTQLEINRSLSDARHELQRMTADRADVAMRYSQEKQRRGNAMTAAESLVNQLKARMSAERHVVALQSGKVVQVFRGRGDVVRRGASVAVISDVGDGLMRCYAFFPLSEGKRAKSGMAARVEPSVADRERFGVIRAAVREIEPVVGARESFLRIMNNPEAIQEVEKRYGGIVSAVIDLEVDSASASGLRWSGGVGYPSHLLPGTLCDVDVVTENVSPITLLIPWMKQVFGG